MSSIYKVEEANTGILEIFDENDKKNIFIPNYDFPESKKLYMDFSNYTDGKYIVKNSFVYNNINFYPFVTSWLYWSFFSQYIKYKPLIDKYLNKEISFIFKNNGKFKQIIDFIDNKNRNTFKHKIYNIMTNFVNKTMLRKKYDLGFYSYGVDDFRVRDIKNILDKKEVNYINVFDMIPKRRLFKDIFTMNINYIGTRYYTNKIYFKDNIDFKDNIIFKIAYQNIQHILSDIVYSYLQQKRLLANCSINKFYGLDDANPNIYSFLLACKDYNIPTIAHQHGVYCNKHLGYVQPITDYKEYKYWYDKVIVWGKYWKNKLLKISKVYDKDSIVIGCNKTKIEFLEKKTIKERKENLNRKLSILIPYEFLANTALIGQYIKKFIKLGHTIYFKPRKDEDINLQLKAYMLEDKYKKQIKIIEEINNDNMGKIDVIAGSFTTLIYDLMVYYKPIWILETESKFLDEMIDENLAYKVKLDEIDNNLLYDKLKVKAYNINDIYNDEKLEKIIEEYVIGKINE